MVLSIWNLNIIVQYASIWSSWKWIEFFSVGIILPMTISLVYILYWHYKQGYPPSPSIWNPYLGVDFKGHWTLAIEPLIRAQPILVWVRLIMHRAVTCVVWQRYVSIYKEGQREMRKFVDPIKTICWQQLIPAVYFYRDPRENELFGSGCYCHWDKANAKIWIKGISKKKKKSHQYIHGKKVNWNMKYHIQT